MIKKDQNTFFLTTKNTSYIFYVSETGQLLHLYYGKRIHGDSAADVEALKEKHEFVTGCSSTLDQDHVSFSPDDECYELSSLGKGDLREPSIVLRHADGSRTSDFRFVEAKVSKGKTALSTMPSSYDESGKVETLTVTMADEIHGVNLEMAYHIFQEKDVITKTVKLVNNGKKKLSIERIMSSQIDFMDADFEMITFNGAWTREMQRSVKPLSQGLFVSKTSAGVSSNRNNSFFMLARANADEDQGEVYGFNLVYSGNHFEACEVSPYFKTRVLQGINPDGFDYTVNPGEAFEAPEAVMTYSNKGFNGMSQNMHHFVRENIVRGEWKTKERPILLNSWEAMYFKINEGKLLKLAKAAKGVGAELFVMDDGWFEGRNSDSTSLGDWTPDKKKLPNGLKGIASKVKALGLDFGIWVEPEMVSVKSKLYAAHPEWAMAIPGQPHSEGRNQRVLDLSRVEVQDYIIDAMSQVFSSAEISYVKWDMNRNFTDVFSSALPAEQQGEVAHRYVMGLYRVMKELTEKFPHILFEGCASGGNRFDLGILSYFPQIWGSDDTDALMRADIQTGYSYGYPLSTVSAHVSGAINHQTLRHTPLETRFAVASYGVLGYECNLADMKKEELEEIKVQIALYKEWRNVMFSGDFYRGRSFNPIHANACQAYHFGSAGIGASVTEWTVVSKDKKTAVGMLMNGLNQPNFERQYFKANGLAEDKKYHFSNEEKKYSIKLFGDLINTSSPVHVKPDSRMQNMLSKFVKLNGEKEDYVAYGDAIMNAGVQLRPSFSGTGYNDNTSLMTDFSSRLYFMKVEK